MRICPVCGKENVQDDTQFCSYCGATLVLQHSSGSTASASMTPQPQGPYISEVLSFDLSQRYERALRRVEQLSNLVLILSVILLIIII